MPDIVIIASTIIKNYVAIKEKKSIQRKEMIMRRLLLIWAALLENIKISWNFSMSASKLGLPDCMKQKLYGYKKKIFWIAWYALL